MKELLEDAMKEAFATSRSSVATIEALQISHPDVAEDIYLVRALRDLTLTLETAAVVVHKAANFAVSLPPVGDQGVQELGLTFDNVNRQVSAYMETVKESVVPVTVSYRLFLSDDLTTPQLKTPLVLYLSDVRVTLHEVQGRATFADIINRKFPVASETYKRSRFPGLGDDR